MARTVQAVLTRVRELVQDADGTRYTDEQLCSHTVDAIQTARSTRPDLFVGAFLTPLPDTLLPGDTLPLPDQLFAAVSYYVAGSAELRDDEFAVDGRAITLQQAYNKKLISGM